MTTYSFLCSVLLHITCYTVSDSDLHVSNVCNFIKQLRKTSPHFRFGKRSSRPLDSILSVSSLSSTTLYGTSQHNFLSSLAALLQELQVGPLGQPIDIKRRQRRSFHPHYTCYLYTLTEALQILFLSLSCR